MKHIVRISDGVGNQLFQYAFAYALYRNTGDEVILDPFFWRRAVRNYSLANYSISLSEKLVPGVFDWILGFSSRKGQSNLRKYRDLITKNYDVIQEAKPMAYDGSMLAPKRDALFIGFWQNYRYFDKFRDELAKEFSRKKSISNEAKRYIEMVGQQISVSMHIRRTDYVKREGKSVAVKLDYYTKALEILDDRLGEYKLFVFSDDKQFVKDHFKEREYTLVEGLADIDDLEIMKACDHHIVANSSFSWWGAYLGKKDGITVAPMVDIWIRDFYPESWIVLEADI